MSTNPNMEAIETITATTSVASITFSNIPQGYTDLVLNLSARVDAANGVAQLYFNGSTAVDKQWRRLYGDGSTATSDSSNGLSAYFRPIGINRSDQTASTFGNMSIYIPNYASTSTYKSMSADGVNENNATFAEAAFGAGLWQSNSAISSVTIIPSAGNFVQHSTATLYGVTSAATAAKATGGIIAMDDNYFYHTFLASGTFTPSQALYADYLVVAGGGGTNATPNDWVSSGGGGAGGLRSTVTATGGGGSLESALSLTAQAYTVTIGAGGAGGTAPTGAGSNGSNSVFSTITSTGGGRGGNTFNSPNTGGSGGAGGTPGAQNGAAGTANQGYAGGNSAGSTSTNGGGGGGGANAVGANANGSGAGGNGGAGVATSISGASVTYAGGGGGGGQTTGGSAGAGGGGTGSSGNGQGTAGTANTGGGGGGGSRNNSAGSYAGNNGGSGIVIVRYAK